MKAKVTSAKARARKEGLNFDMDEYRFDDLLAPTLIDDNHFVDITGVPTSLEHWSPDKILLLMATFPAMGVECRSATIL